MSQPQAGAGGPLGLGYPNTARVWNYLIGGKDNFAVDREAADRMTALMQEVGAPTGAQAAVENRDGLQRAVDYLIREAGIRQFLDLGSGLPNMGNTHQVAQRRDPDAKVAYVDIDPMVSSHAAALMAGQNVATVVADLREPQQVIENEAVRQVLDFDEPVALLFISMLHCLSDEEDPWGVVRRFRDAVVPGSYLVISHLSNEARPEAAAHLLRISREMHMSTPLVPRSRDAIARYFEGFTLVDPGLVYLEEWRPELHDPFAPPPIVETGDDADVHLPAFDDPRGAKSHMVGVGVKD
jgi:hypothetical protein